MRSLKIFGWFLLCVIAVVAIVSWLLPAKQYIERSVIINSPAKTIFEKLSRLETFNLFSVWGRNDSLIKNEMEGTDGTVGAISTWKGDPDLSGEGKIEITSLEPNKNIHHQITFLSPRKAEAESEFILDEKNGQTTVTWKFDLLTPRPWNILNLFSGLDKKMGKDFDQGLANLKSLVENKTGKTQTKYEVKEMNFPSTTYAQYRQAVKLDEIQKFFAMNLHPILSEIQKSGVSPGVPTGLYYSWDENNQEADMAAAIPVPAGTTLNEPTITIETISASKALYVDFYGSYDKLKDAYDVLDKYLAENKLKQKAPAIEQYITDPQSETDPSKWHTRIIFLVE